jgi:V8-like Glu-specific endopeptidase
MILASKKMKMKCFSKQPQFIRFFSMLLSVVAFYLCASISNAQLQFREPQSETLNFQRSGLDSAVSEVACESGEPKLQSAVLWQYTDDKPQFIYGDDGSKTCIGGSCLKKASETGQQPTRCTPKKIDVKVFGEDDRNNPRAFLNAEEQNTFSGVGRIECPTRGGRIVGGTAFHLGSYDTLVTNAHVFENIDTGEKYDRSRCVVAFYDSAGNKKETVQIDTAITISRWDEPGMRGDPTNDVAIIKLVRESSTPNYMYGYKHSATEPMRPTNARLVGFHGDVVNNKVIRQTFGKILSAPNNNRGKAIAEARGFQYSNPENMLVADFDSNHGTSGAPVFDDNNQVIGINRGGTNTPSKANDTNFSEVDNYNSIIRLDARFHRDLQRIKSLKSRAGTI